MNYTNLIVIALRALYNNKLRGLLTMLGIIIGVASVISMLAIGQGSKESIQESIAEIGSNMVVITPGNGQFGGVRQSGTDMQSLKLEDYNRVMNEVALISKSSPYVQKSGQVIYGSNNSPTTIYGVTQGYMNVRRLTVARGEMFTDHDLKSSSKVCVIGQTIVDNLFPNGEEPLGQTIRFDKTPFRVIGVFAVKGYNSMGRDQDDLIVAPFSTIQKRLLAISHIQGINVSVVAEEYTDAAIADITSVLQQSHNIAPGQENDFNVRSLEEMTAMMTMTTNLMTILLACIAGISLLVGGIGIMNIMYVSVTERTREIGLRMSIGAKGRHILFQFLVEAVIISITGGIIGVLLGIGVSMLIKYGVGWPISIQLYAVIISFLVCSATGIFFGWYPAKKASGLNPIDAIRYE